MLTLEEYGCLNKTQQNSIKKTQLEEILKAQLALLNNDPNEIRNVITTAINQAIDKKFEQLSLDFTVETKRLSEENVILRKVIVEQQK